ncbi:MAG: methionyl-tRNA formyltransferase [Alphaproteobacteria bacterium]|nr:methionyl-tRNA formyltransferase [Alphaproteobacteria bacterium]
MNVRSDPSLRLVYMGTADFAVPALRALAASRHQVVAVYTQPARPAGRGMRARPSPIERTATELGLPVRTPVTLRGEDEEIALGALAADLAVVAAYGLLLPQAILDTPRLGCINLHGSCLPRWRGAAPIQRAILAGDRESGITIIQMEAGLDTGPMLAMERVAITSKTTASSLHDRLAALAAEMIPPMVDRLAAGSAAPTPQPEEGATYAKKIEKEEGLIDWTEPARTIDRQLRALNPWPGCFTHLADGQRLKVLAGEVESEASTGPVTEGLAAGAVLDDRLRVACGEGVLRITQLQKAGGKPMDAEAFLRGHPLPAGTHLDSPEVG